VVPQQPENQTVLAGSDVNLNVAIAGTGPFTCQWQYNGANLPGLIDPALALIGVAATNAGTYAIAVFSPYGSVTSMVARLTVLPSLSPPVIATQPTNLVGVQDGNVTFNVSVSGTGPFCYQWYGNGAALPPTIATVAGGTITDEVSATNANLFNPYGSAVDACGNLFIADANNHRIRKVGTNGVITTAAGDGAAGYYGDGGPATSASLYFPEGVAVDAAGNLFIADTDNGRIRKVATNGLITTVAGDGGYGFSGDGGPATSASLDDPEGVAVDAAGNLFIADTDNGRIRKVATNGLITTVAGDGGYGYSGDSGPATNASLYYPRGVAVDAWGNLFIADTDNVRIRKVATNGLITTVAGDGGYGYSGNGGPATSASLYYPAGVTVDAAGNLFIADTDNVRIRKVAANGLITTVAGDGGYGYSGDGGAATSASLYYPAGVTVDAAGNLFIADTDNMRIRKVGTNGLITTVAGNGSTGSPGDGGAAANAHLSLPSGVAADNLGNFFIADTDNYRIRRVGSNGLITTVAGNGGYGYSGDGGAATAANLEYPYGVAVDGVGELFIADENNQRVREVGVTGIMTTVAGNGGRGYSGDSVALGPDASLADPYGTAVDAYGNVFIADTDNHRIREITPGGIICTVAGNGTPGYSGDGGAATSASLNSPEGVTVDAAGNVFIADTGNQRIRKVGTNGTITTAAGNGFGGYSGDGGPAGNASLDYPRGVAVDPSSNIFIADWGNHRVRMVSPNGDISSLAGQGGAGFLGDGGPATNASLAYPAGVATDASGNLLVADSENNRIREIWLAGLPILSLSHLTANSAGNYYVVIKGPYGSVTSSVVNLVVDLPPAITAQPQDLSVGLGSNATFTVSAASSEPLTYLWQFGGTSISGATSDSYTVAGVTAANAGGYDVVVANGIGSVTSRVAVLTVLLPPVITQPPQSQAVGIGSNATFSVTASGNGPFYYQWFLNGTNLAGATGSSLTLNTVFPINAGEYSVSVANPYGLTLGGPALLTVLPLSLGTPAMAGGVFQFGFDMAPGVHYTVEYSSDLIAWFPLVTFSGAGPLLILDPNTSEYPRRFYRIVLSR